MNNTNDLYNRWLAQPDLDDAVKAELVSIDVYKRQVDGIHFDDYFYPTTDPAFDAADYAASGTALARDDWRRENVNALVELLSLIHI